MSAESKQQSYVEGLEALCNAIKRELELQAAFMGSAEIMSLARNLLAQDVELGEIGIMAAVVGFLTAKGAM